MDAGWPIGELIGTEPELMTEYSVSRSVLREAIRIVEHHGVARMRRGSGGGLIVTAPDSRAVERPLILYLDYAGVSTHELFTVRVALELTSVELLASNADADGIDRLKKALELEASVGDDGLRTGAPYDLHALIAHLSGNAALGLFIETLAGLGFERTHDLTLASSEFQAQHRAHELIVEAIVCNNVGLAVKRMETHLRAVAEHYPS